MKKSTLLLVTSILLLWAANLQAAPITCNFNTTLSSLLTDAGGGNSCISQDKIYSNFQFSVQNGTLLSSNIGATLTETVLGGGNDQHGWQFSIFGGTLASFTISYTIAVAPGNPGLVIYEAQDQMQDGTAAQPFTIQAVDTETIGVLTVNNGSTDNETIQKFFDGVTSINTSVVITNTGSSSLNNFGQVWFEHVVPEPASLILLGTGLLGLALVGRRIKK